MSDTCSDVSDTCSDCIDDMFWHVSYDMFWLYWCIGKENVSICIFYVNSRKFAMRHLPLKPSELWRLNNKGSVLIELTFLPLMLGEYLTVFDARMIIITYLCHMTYELIIYLEYIIFLYNIFSLLLFVSSIWGMYSEATNDKLFALMLSWNGTSKCGIWADKFPCYIYNNCFQC